MKQMLELSDRDIKALVSMFQWTIINANKTKIESFSKQIYSLGKEIFNEISKLRNTIIKQNLNKWVQQQNGGTREKNK